MISVIMPAYDEAENVERAIAETVSTLEQCRVEWEVIVVDDGSKDATFEKASSIARQLDAVRIFTYSDNMGKGYALKYGFQFTHGEQVLFLDTDSDLPPSQIPTFLEYMSNSRNDVVIGSKRHPLSEINLPLFRRFLSRGYYLVTKVLFNLDIRDSQVGIKLFHREVLERVLPKILVKKYAFDIEVLAIAHRLGYRIMEAPVTLKWHPSREIDFRAVWRMFVDTIAVFYRMKILHYYDHAGEHVQQWEEIRTVANYLPRGRQEGDGGSAAQDVTHSSGR